MSTGLKHSEAIKGQPVTTYNTAGGIGFGYLLNGRVWKTTGSFYAIDATQDVFPMVRYEEDNGEGYRKATKGLLDVSKMDTLNKINMVLANDAVSFEAKKHLLNTLDRGIGEVWENYFWFKTGK